MGLLVVDHLDAMLDRAVEAIGVGQILGEPAARDARRAASAASASSVAGARKRRVAAAVDHLLRLGEEFDLADPAAAALEVIAGAERLDLGVMVAHAEADVCGFRRSRRNRARGAR